MSSFIRFLMAENKYGIINKKYMYPLTESEKKLSIKSIPHSIRNVWDNFDNISQNVDMSAVYYYEMNTYNEFVKILESVVNNGTPNPNDLKKLNTIFKNMRYDELANTGVEQSKWDSIIRNNPIKINMYSSLKDIEELDDNGKSIIHNVEIQMTEDIYVGKKNLGYVQYDGNKHNVKKVKKINNYNRELLNAPANSTQKKNKYEIIGDMSVEYIRPTKTTKNKYPTRPPLSKMYKELFWKLRADIYTSLYDLQKQLDDMEKNNGKSDNDKIRYNTPSTEDFENFGDYTARYNILSIERMNRSERTYNQYKNNEQLVIKDDRYETFKEDAIKEEQKRLESDIYYMIDPNDTRFGNIRSLPKNPTYYKSLIGGVTEKTLNDKTIPFVVGDMKDYSTHKHGMKHSDSVNYQDMANQNRQINKLKSDTYYIGELLKTVDNTFKPNNKQNTANITKKEIDDSLLSDISVNDDGDFKYERQSDLVYHTDNITEIIRGKQKITERIKSITYPSNYYTPRKIDNNGVPTVVTKKVILEIYNNGFPSENTENQTNKEDDITTYDILFTYDYTNPKNKKISYNINSESIDGSININNIIDNDNMSNSKRDFWTNIYGEDKINTLSPFYGILILTHNKREKEKNLINQ